MPLAAGQRCADGDLPARRDPRRDVADPPRRGPRDARDRAVRAGPSGRGGGARRRGRPARRVRDRRSRRRRRRRNRVRLTRRRLGGAGPPRRHQGVIDMSTSQPSLGGSRAGDRSDRDVERPASLAGRRPVVRGDHRPDRRQPGMGGIDAADANGEPERATARGERGLRRLQRGRRRTTRTSSSSSSSTAAPGAAADPAFKAAVGDLVAKLTARRRALDGVADAHVRPAGRPVPRPARGRSRRAGRVDGPDRRPDRGRRRPGHAADRAGLPILAEARAAQPEPRHPCRQQHVHQRRHQRADLDGPRRFAPPDDPADVHHPAVRVRGDRGLGRAARPGHHLAGGRLRDPGHLQPDRRTGQPQCHAAHRADRAGRRGRLLAVHDHPVPRRTARRP